MKRTLFLTVIILIIISSCQTLSVTQYDITYSYIKNGETITEQESFLYYSVGPGKLEGKLTNNKYLIADYPGIKVEKILRYEIRL